MTKTNNTSHRVPLYRRPIVIVIGLVIIAVVAVLVVFIVKAVSSSQEVDPDNSNSVTAEAPFKEEEVTTPGYEEATKIGDEKTIPQYEAENPNTLEELTGSIVYTDIESGTVTTMVSIDQYLYNGGTCELKIKSGSTIVTTASSPIVADVTTSHCGPITASIQSSGTYELEITFSADNKTGLITTNINI